MPRFSRLAHFACALIALSALIAAAPSSRAQGFFFFPNTARIDYKVSDFAVTGYANFGDFSSKMHATSPVVDILPGGLIVQNVFARSGSTINARGGLVGGGIYADDNSTINVRGGKIGGFFASSTSTVNFFGTGLSDTLLNNNYPFLGQTYSVYLLHGTLSDGSSIDNKPLLVQNGSTVAINFYPSAAAPLGTTGLILQQQSTGGISVALFRGVGQIGYNVTLPSEPQGRTVAGIADLNGDGSADLLFQDTSGAVSYLLLNGTAPLSNPNSSDGMFDGFVFPAVPAGLHVVGTPDLLGDGNADILFENSSTGDVGYSLLSGLTPGLSGYIFRGLSTDVHIVGTPDLNGDGHPDIIWQSQSTGKVYYQLMNGVTPLPNSFGVLFNSVPAGFVVVGTADLTGNGRPDILLQNRTSGDVVYIIMDGFNIINSGYLLRSLPADYKVVGAY